MQDKPDWHSQRQGRGYFPVTTPQVLSIMYEPFDLQFHLLQYLICLQLMHKLSVEAPPKILVERYLIEIAKNYNVPYEPDAMVRVCF